MFNAIDWLLRVIEYAIFGRVIISWIPISKDNQLIRLLFQITEPILAPIKSLIAKSSLGKNTMIDFSPFIAILIIELLRSIVRRFFLF